MPFVLISQFVVTMTTVQMLTHARSQICHCCPALFWSNDAILPPVDYRCWPSCLHIPLNQSAVSLQRSSAEQEQDHCVSENSFRNFQAL